MTIAVPVGAGNDIETLNKATREILGRFGCAGWLDALWDGLQSRHPPQQVRFRTPFVAAEAAPTG
ncbi:hypothetical protein, partial [Xanthomonas graminis]|uniref:hypothetical protein n=1 Tax=Xanthomonas graminis TaxID=3390026 RepID=UPI00159F26E6